MCETDEFACIRQMSPIYRDTKNLLLGEGIDSSHQDDTFVNCLKHSVSVIICNI